MKEYCDKMKNIWGKTTNEHDEQLCREGNELIEVFLRERPRMSPKDYEMIGWANTVSKILDRCRWIECRPEEKITNEPARMSFQDKVMSGLQRMKQWNRMRQRQMNQPKSAGEGNEMKIISNIEDYRGIDIKAGDGDDDKTVIASNTWEKHAMYAGRDGHYEELEQYDSWNDGYSRLDNKWDETWAENDPDPPMYEE